MPLPFFFPLLFSPCLCLGGELTAVASSRVCLVAAGFGCQVLGYHSLGGIWVSDRLWRCAPRSCEARSEVVSGQAASSTAQPHADRLPLSLPTSSSYGIGNPHAGLLWPLWVESGINLYTCFVFFFFCFKSSECLLNFATQ